MMFAMICQNRMLYKYPEYLKKLAFLPCARCNTWNKVMQRIIQWLQHKWRIRMVMTMMMIIAITLTSVTFTTVNWFEAKTLLLNAATMQGGNDQSNHGTKKYNKLLILLKQCLRVLAFDPVVDASTLPPAVATPGGLTQFVCQSIIESIYWL